MSCGPIFTAPGITAGPRSTADPEGLGSQRNIAQTCSWPHSASITTDTPDTSATLKTRAQRHLPARVVVVVKQRVRVGALLDGRQAMAAVLVAEIHRAHLEGAHIAERVIAKPTLAPAGRPRRIPRKPVTDYTPSPTSAAPRPSCSSSSNACRPCPRPSSASSSKSSTRCWHKAGAERRASCANAAVAHRQNSKAETTKPAEWRALLVAANSGQGEAHFKARMLRR